MGPAGMFWGFIPDYVNTYEDLKNMREGYVGVMGNYLAGKPMLNVRAEDMLDNEVFADAAMNRRCLVISTEFYETRHLPKIGKRGQLLKATDPYPYRITIPDADYFLMAAIYNPWVVPDSGEVVDTFAIVTTEANSLVSQIHNVKKRMPVVFTPGDKKAWQWTNPNLSAGKIKELSTYQFAGENMEAHPVAKDFLSAEDPTAECYYPGLPKLVNL